MRNTCKCALQQIKFRLFRKLCLCKQLQIASLRCQRNHFMALLQTNPCETADDILYHVILNNTRVSLISSPISLNSSLVSQTSTWFSLTGTLFSLNSILVSLHYLHVPCFRLPFILGLGLIPKSFPFW